MSMMSALVKDLRDAELSCRYHTMMHSASIAPILLRAADAIEALSAKVGDTSALQESLESGEDANSSNDIQRAIETLETLRMCETGDCDEDCRDCRRYIIPSADLVSAYDAAIAALQEKGMAKKTAGTDHE